MSTKIHIIDTIEELLPFEKKWQALADESCECNLFYEPMMFLPAFQYLTEGIKIFIVLVEDEATGALIGFFPLKLEKRYRKLPIKHYSLWRHVHSVTTVPLVAKGMEKKCMDAFVLWSTSSDRSMPWIRFQFFTDSQGLKDTLFSVAAEYDCRIDDIDFWRRALLSSDLDGKIYLSRFINKKQMKEYRRLWKRLSEQGELEFYSGRINNQEASDWYQHFLELESSGWKGRKGSSISDNENEKMFFSEAIKNASSRNCLSISTLTINNKIIASECSFSGVAHSIMLKITYNENYAKFSPGVLLILKKTEQTLDSEANVWIDSCAVPNHPMIDHLWRQKIDVFDFSISNGRFSSNARLSLIHCLVNIKRIIFRQLSWR